MNAASCSCGSIGAVGELRLCSPCHRYFWGDKHLPSVTQILHECFPDEYKDAPSERVEYARERGVIVDALISDYVVGKEPMIPAGSPNDPELHNQAIALFDKFQKWYDKQGFKNVRAQAMVTDGEIAGTIDLWPDELIIDVKTVYRLMRPHPIQVGGYSVLSGGSDMMLVHLTERYAEPKIKEVKASSRDDWRITRAFWELKQRL